MAFSLAKLFTRKPAPLAVRRFDGATGGRRGWGMGTFGRVNPEVAAAAAPVRSRARYLAANSPFIANAVGNYSTALSGTGINRVLWDVRALDAAIDGLPTDPDSPDAESSDINEWDS